MLSKGASETLLDWKAFSSRIISARFHYRIRKVLIVQCSCGPKRKHYLLIMMGDFNAKIGKDNIEKELVMGKEGLGEINENGELFTDFCYFNILVIGGSVFPHKKIHKTTWISPDHQTENQIDHICISSTFRRSLQDVRSRRGADVGTDHHLVTRKIKFKLKRYHPMAAKPGFRYNTELLRYIKTKYIFQLELANRYQLLSNLFEDEQWNKCGNKANQHGMKHVKRYSVRKTSQHKDWISAKTLGKAAERKQRKATINNSKTRAAKTEAHRLYTEANKEVKRSVKRDKKDFVERMAGQAEVAAGQRNLKELYDITWRLADEHVVDKTGKVLINQADQHKTD